jgi:hypothetical protein
MSKAARQTQQPAASVALGIPQPYRPRPLRFIRYEQLGDWRLKVYGIALPGRSPRGALVEATVARAAEVLPQPARADGRFGVGFVIAHDSATVSIGLVYWWDGVNELHQRAYTGPLDAPRALAPLKHAAAGCVWELGIIDFERRAWLEDVLANPAGPDLERYMQRQLDTEV